MNNSVTPNGSRALFIYLSNAVEKPLEQITNGREADQITNIQCGDAR